MDVKLIVPEKGAGNVKVMRYVLTCPTDVLAAEEDHRDGHRLRKLNTIVDVNNSILRNNSILANKNS